MTPLLDRRGYSKQYARNATRAVLGTLLAYIFGVLLLGCSRIRTYDVVALPQSPALIAEVSGAQARVLMFNQDTKKLEEYGWITITPGLTLLQFDWTAVTGSPHAEQ